MKQRQRIYYTEAQKALMWECWRKVDSLQHIARLFRRNLVLTPGHLMCTGAIAYEVAGFSFDHFAPNYLKDEFHCGSGLYRRCLFLAGKRPLSGRAFIKPQSVRPS